MATLCDRCHGPAVDGPGSDAGERRVDAAPSFFPVPQRHLRQCSGQCRVAALRELEHSTGCDGPLCSRTHSLAQSRSGTCSHHGGVAEWL